MKRVLLANGDKVELFYSFKTSKEMVGLKSDVSRLEEISKKYGKETEIMDFEDEDMQVYLDSLSKIICAVLNGSRYPCELEEVDFLINEELINRTIELLEEQKKKEESVAKKKAYVSSKKK
ncbi:hypothetical protein [Alkalibacter mobilis]|uniref:hypothetical protein n=1 Tax=Alkalibacter mobilis TaxID=2787712 RepID=UPI0018A0C655|nr:hypothetical protein [Alkalibacter mobilis]MBF7097576.1 hypothetical protein [Alkalibacter mobilis]